MAHLVTSAPFRAGHLPVSGQLCEAAAEGGSPGAPVSCDLSACRHSLVGHPFPPWELVLPCGWLTGTNPDPDGVSTFRTARDPTGEGALCTPGPRCSHGRPFITGRRARFPAPGPPPGPSSPLPGALARGLQASAPLR